MRLPSERYVPGDPRPVGFVDEMDSEHVTRCSELLHALVAQARQVTQPLEGRALRIRFCHVQYAPGMPFNLFGFNIFGITEAGALADPYEEGKLLYALVSNQPAELQLEVAVAFLTELAARQRLLTQAADDEETFLALPDRARAATEQTPLNVSDHFRHGWRSAVNNAVLELNAAGLRVEIEYQLDPFPTKADLDRRLPWLRRVYNELDSVRMMVDKTVSAVGGAPPAMRAAGGSEEIREFSQQHLALLDLRHYMNHATRDGEVCGNGYLIISDVEPFAGYCALPESVTFLSDGQYEIQTESGTRRLVDRVVHVKGIPQLGSPYGISLLEPFVFAIERSMTLRDVISASEKWLGAPDLDTEVRSGIQARVDLAKQMLGATTSDIDRLVEFFREHVSEPYEALYLPGHETYRL